MPGVYELTKAMITQPLVIGGRAFIKGADMDARPEYEFSGDGFHPGAAAQAKVAQLIVDAFRAKYPLSPIAPLTDAEILSGVLGLSP